MVQINGNNFNVYTLDTLDTIKQRISTLLNTIPDLLYFPGDESYEDFLQDKNIIAVNILNTILTSARNNTSLVELLDNIKDRVPPGLTEKIIEIWLINNDEENKRSTDENDALFEELIENDYLLSRPQFLRLLESNRNINDEILTLVNKIKTKEKNFKIFQDLPEYKSADFETEKVTFEIKFGIRNKSLLDLFNEILLTGTVPFTTIKNFYKILNDFSPPYDWVFTMPDILVLYVSQNKNVKSTLTDDYTKVYIQIKGDVGDQYMYATSEIKIDPLKFVNRLDFIDRVKSVFETGLGKLDVENITEQKLTGVFYYPDIGKNFNNYIYSDMVMNDPMFSSLISMDDSSKATKDKTSAYIHFYHPLIGNLTATITPGIVTKINKYMKGKDKNLFPLGGKYIRIRIANIKDMKSLNIFREIMGKLFRRYTNNYDTVINEYNLYLTPQEMSLYLMGKEDEDEDEDKKEEEEADDYVGKRLKDIAPNLYISNYSKKCKFFPTIINKKEADIQIAAGKSVLKFPRDIQGEDAIPFKNDGVDQHYYICNYAEKNYPGLMVNKLPNKDIYPYLPCCYKTPKLGVKKPMVIKKYDHYYNNIPITDDKVGKKSIITTNKSLVIDQFGELPKNIKKLFSLIDPTYQYKRKGVVNTNSENSFLTAVMEAMTTLSEMKNPDEREFAVGTQRENLATPEDASLAKQEIFDKSSVEIQQIIQNQNMYFDPHLFVHILEDAFNCNIFIFSSLDDVDGKLTLPRHMEAYYKYRKDEPCVYIYEHMGADSERLTIPKCELITRILSEDKQDFVFSYENAKNVRMVYQKLRLSYALDVVIEENIFPINKPRIELVSQYIDAFGKTRQIDIRYRETIISIITEPIQPLRLPETNDLSIHRVNPNILKRLIVKLNITNVEQDAEGITGLLGNVTIKILMEREEKKEEEKVSVMDTYNKNKKDTRYLVSWLFWLFSHYAKNKQITNKIIEKFALTIIVDPNIKYGKITQAFNANSNSGIIKDNRLVIPSNEVLKRLIYVLRLENQRNHKNLVEYYKREYIPNYFLTLEDFDKYSIQSVLYGDESVIKWLDETLTTYILSKEVIFGIVTPYFFKNSLVDNQIYLAQNTDSISKAIDIIEMWKERKYNIGIDAQNVEVTSFTLYTYVNENNINALRVSGNAEGDFEDKILGYKLNGAPFYTALLRV